MNFWRLIIAAAVIVNFLAAAVYHAQSEDFDSIWHLMVAIFLLIADTKAFGLRIEK